MHPDEVQAVSTSDMKKIVATMKEEAEAGGWDNDPDALVLKDDRYARALARCLARTHDCHLPRRRN